MKINMAVVIKNCKLFLVHFEGNEDKNLQP